MFYKITYTCIKGIKRSVIYQGSSPEGALKIFHMLTSNRNIDTVISVELTD